LIHHSITPLNLLTFPSLQKIESDKSIKNLPRIPLSLPFSSI
jgi:hypothetical protein